MAKSYFAILGVTVEASQKEIRSAYRRLAKEYHPDYYKGDSEAFRQIQEAYAVLGDPHRRKAYEKSHVAVKVRRTETPALGRKPEPLIPEAIPAAFEDMSSARARRRFAYSTDDIFDRFWRSDSLFDRFGLERGRHLTIEVKLSRDAAASGGIAKLIVPARVVCPACGGSGGSVLFACRRCGGSGAVTEEVPVPVPFPAGIFEDHSAKISLERFGMQDTLLTVVFRPQDKYDR